MFTIGKSDVAYRNDVYKQFCCGFVPRANNEGMHKEEFLNAVKFLVQTIWVVFSDLESESFPVFLKVAVTVTVTS